MVGLYTTSHAKPDDPTRWKPLEGIAFARVFRTINCAVSASILAARRLKREAPARAVLRKVEKQRLVDIGQGHVSEIGKDLSFKAGDDVAGAHRLPASQWKRVPFTSYHLERLRQIAQL